MPLYEYLCLGCGQVSEVLIIGSEDDPECSSCGGHNLKKLISAHSSASGLAHDRMPGAGDTTCCGTAPHLAEGCAGPGSCCGKT